MDYRRTAEAGEVGGSDACINLAEADNTGLESCINSNGIPGVFDQVKAKVSLADFLVIISEAAMARAATDWNSNDIYATGTLA